MTKCSSYYTADFKLKIVDALCSYMYFALGHEALVFNSHSYCHHTELCFTTVRKSSATFILVTKFDVQGGCDLYTSVTYIPAKYGTQ